MNPILRSLARLLPAQAKARLRALRSRPQGGVSQNYRTLGEGAAPRALQSWQNPRVAVEQFTAFQGVLNNGVERADFEALRQSFGFLNSQKTLENPLVLEVGCGSCWNYEILRAMNFSFRYLGLDVSLPMLQIALQSQPELQVVVGDAQKLPFSNQSVDIVLSGTSLMHIPDWKTAIVESRRVARHFCVFHTVPIAQHAPTTSFEKDAYGAPVWEWCFNESELLEVLRANQLEVCAQFPSLPYNLQDVVGEPTTTATFVCRVGDGR